MIRRKTQISQNPQGLTPADMATINTVLDAFWYGRVDSQTSSAAPAINTDTLDMFILTAQAVDITSFTTNLTGTPHNGQKLWIAITGTAARGITWGTGFEASTVALPTTTVSTDRLDCWFIYNTATSKWRLMGKA